LRSGSQAKNTIGIKTLKIPGIFNNQHWHILSTNSLLDANGVSSRLTSNRTSSIWNEFWIILGWRPSQRAVSVIPIESGTLCAILILNPEPLWTLLLFLFTYRGAGIKNHIELLFGASNMNLGEKLNIIIVLHSLFYISLISLGWLIVMSVLSMVEIIL
jgi:hypothetical protein